MFPRIMIALSQPRSVAELARYHSCNNWPRPGVTNAVRCTSIEVEVDGDGPSGIGGLREPRRRPEVHKGIIDGCLRVEQGALSRSSETSARAANFTAVVRRRCDLAGAHRSSGHAGARSVGPGCMGTRLVASTHGLYP